MKNKVKFHKGEFGDNSDHITYKDNTVGMEVYRDGSGDIFIDKINYYDGSGTHHERVAELKKVHEALGKAISTLEQIKNPIVYFPKKDKK